MTIDERARHELFLAAERSLGRPQTETLMALLPPVGWAEVATKHDLAALEERMSLRFDMVDRKFDMVDERFSSLGAHLGTRFEMVDERFASLGAHLGTRFEMVDQKFDTQTAYLLGELDRRFNAQTRTLFLSLAGLMISLTTLVIAVR